MHVCFLFDDGRALAAKAVLPFSVSIATTPATLPKAAPDAFVLPIPLTRDGIHATPPFEGLTLDELGALLPKESLLIGYGLPPSAFGNRPYANLEDIASFIDKNAELTAEGGMLLLLQALKDAGGLSLADTVPVILGYGRIARGMATRLSAFGANVLVGARRSEARAAAQDAGYIAFDTEDKAFFKTRGKHLFEGLPHILINTAPSSSPIPSAEDIPFLILCLELSGKPSPRHALEGFPCPFLDGKALPSRMTPFAAGVALADAVADILKNS